MFTLLHRGVAVAWTGQHQAAEADLLQALHLAETERRDAVRLQCETHLAAVAAVDGDLSTMGARARTALALAVDRGWAETSRCSFTYALLCADAYERADDEQARRFAALATGLLDGPVDPSIELFVRTIAAIVRSGRR
jgi:LuxR family maltose regulon positive regulatory protein